MELVVMFGHFFWSGAGFGGVECSQIGSKSRKDNACRSRDTPLSYIIWYLMYRLARFIIKKNIVAP